MIRMIKRKTIEGLLVKRNAELTVIYLRRRYPKMPDY